MDPIETARWVGLVIGLPTIVTVLGMVIKIAFQIGRWQRESESRNQHLNVRIDALNARLDGVNGRLDHVNGNIGDAHHRLDTHLEGH